MSQVHLAGSKDLEKLLPLVAAFHAEEGVESDETHLRAALSPLLEGSPHGAIYIAGPRLGPVGYIIFCFGWSIEFGGLDGYVDELYVRPGMRGRGIGSDLLVSGAKALAAGGVMSLTLEVDHDNETAKTLYTRLGFKDRGRYGLMNLKLRDTPL